MKICLGTVVRNEAYFLPKTFPIFVDAFDGIIAVDNGSTDDTKDILMGMGATVIDGNYNDIVLIGRNSLIPEAEKQGYDAMLVIDADEGLFLEEARQIKQHLENSELIMMPRINFVKDFQHYNPSLYPDTQGRGFHLNKGYKWVGHIHEFLHKGDDTRKAMQTEFAILLPDCPIYHYGLCDNAEDLYIKYTNYSHREQGLETIDEVPHNTIVDPSVYWGATEKFNGNHPLNDRSKIE